MFRSITKIIVFSFCLSFLIQSIAFSQEADNSKLYKFAVKLFTAEPQDKEGIYAEFNTLSPAEKNEVSRILRKIIVSQDRNNVSEEEYQNWQKLEEVFLIAEDIAIERYNMALDDLPEDILNKTMEEALSRYPGSVQLESSSSCPLLSYPIWYPAQDPLGAPIFSPTSLMRVINVPGEFPCDYDLRFNVISKNHVWGLIPLAQLLLADFGSGVNGRNQPDHIHLIFGYFRTIRRFPVQTERHLMTQFVVW